MATDPLFYNLPRSHNPSSTLASNMDMDYEISIISGSYGGHRQHTSEDGQNWGSGISSFTPEPETLSKLFNQGASMEKI